MSGSVAQELRRAFDAAFASPAEDAVVEDAQMLGIVSGAHRVALAIAQIQRVQRRPSLVPVPGGGRGLLGLGAVRGQMVAFYDLETLLAGSGRPENENAGGRYAALCAPSTALVFDALPLSMRVPRSALRRQAGAEASFELGGERWDVIDVPALLERHGILSTDLDTPQNDPPPDVGDREPSSRVGES